MESNSCQITDLNPYCVSHLFSFLTERELISVERVCKDWQAESLKSWTQRKIVRVEINPSDGEHAKILESVLRRCGSYVIFLDISSVKAELWVAVELIIKYCKALKQLDIGNECRSLKDIDALSEIVPSLEELSMGELKDFSDEELAILFKKCINLKSLSFGPVSSSAPTSRFHGKCLKLLNPDKLEKVVINCHTIDMHQVITYLGNMRLKTLFLNHADKMTGTECLLISELFPDLAHLSISYVQCYDDIPVGFLYLQNLVSLDLSCSQAVVDSVVIEISQHCIVLKTLDISACGSEESQDKAITDAGICSVAKMPFLEDLSMSLLPYTTDNSLEALAMEGKLRKLDVMGNAQFTDAACALIIVLCKDLYYFDMNDCTEVSDAVLAAADEALKLSCKKLTLVVGGTKIDSEKMCESVICLGE